MWGLWGWEWNAPWAVLPLLSHILPIFLTINIEKPNKTHISSLALNYRYQGKRGLLINCEFLLPFLFFIFSFFFSFPLLAVSEHRNSRALCCFPSFDSTGAKQSLISPSRLQDAERLRGPRGVATGRPGWKAISGGMDTDINILAGCFVIIMIRRGGGKKGTQCCENATEWKEGKERKRERGLACAAGGGV